MIQVAEAEHIVLSESRDYGTEAIAFDASLGRVLAENIRTDRDLPPYDRVAMDGIAIRYSEFEAGTRAFTIQGTQAAGDEPIEADGSNTCIEIMTGAALPEGFDTVVRYEDIVTGNGIATIQVEDIRKGQNIHRKATDKKANEIVVSAGQVIGSTVINMAASVGKTVLQVKTLPKVVVITTGEELVQPGETPTPYQVRQSNNYAMQAVLRQYRLEATLLHIPDNATIAEEQLSQCLQDYDVLILSGGVSKGKFDYIPQVLEALQVKQLFHKVQQRPGKPFWFGRDGNGKLVFAFPGNPVSTFLCLHRYFLPWLRKSLGIRSPSHALAILNEDFSFKPALQYFLQVRLHIDEDGRLLATPVEGHGSGDFTNLLQANAFMELPAEKDNFKQGEVYRIWTFKSTL